MFQLVLEWSVLSRGISTTAVWFNRIPVYRKRMYPECPLFTAVFADSHLDMYRERLSVTQHSSDRSRYKSIFAGRSFSLVNSHPLRWLSIEFVCNATRRLRLLPHSRASVDCRRITLTETLRWQQKSRFELMGIPFDEIKLHVTYRSRY